MSIDPGVVHDPAGAEGSSLRAAATLEAADGRFLQCRFSLSDFFYDRGWDFAGDLIGNLSDWFSGMIDQYGVFGAIGLLFVEEAGIPILLPGDVMVMYAGY